jgi:hypothetical protein
MGLLLLLGATGFLGDGALARTRVRAGDGVTVTYPRVARTQAPSELRIDVAGGAGDSTRILLPARLAERVALAGMAPAAAAERAAAGGRLLVVAHEGARRGRIALRLRPLRPGRVRDTLRVDGAPAPVDILVLP